MSLTPAALEELARKGAERGVDLRPGLEGVEAALREKVAADLPFVEEASRYLMDAGGKRFRPMLVLLCGMLAGAPGDDEALVDAGVIVELVHLSTLYHDDVIDDASVRRGAPTVHVQWSNTVAILVGDFLLARASQLSAALGVEVTKLMARTITDLCQGQIREMQGSLTADRRQLPRITPTRDHYLTVIGEKTASLIAASCRLGGMLTGQPAAAVEALGTYGWHLGMSFQLADDVLDIAGRQSESGKTPGTDLREGVFTLPVLLALEAERDGSPLHRHVAGDGGALSDDDVAEALRLLRAHPALEEARDAARREAAEARRALDALHAPRVPAALDGLRHLADYAADRAT